MRKLRFCFSCSSWGVFKVRIASLNVYDTCHISITVEEWLIVLIVLLPYPAYWQHLLDLCERSFPVQGCMKWWDFPISKLCFSSKADPLFVSIYSFLRDISSKFTFIEYGLFIKGAVPEQVHFLTRRLCGSIGPIDVCTVCFRHRFATRWYSQSARWHFRFSSPFIWESFRSHSRRRLQ